MLRWQKEMMSNQIKALFDRLDELKESALENPAPDYPSYRERVGHYNGLKEAIQILLDLDSDKDD